MSILITGGTGYIGSHTAVEILNAGYDIVIADNFYNSSPEVLKRIEIITGKKPEFFECDVCDKQAVKELFDKYPDIDSVIHFAAYKAVGESVEKPLDYYENNIGGALCVLQEMQRRGVKNYVFSSSATVYGEPEKIPCDETCYAGSATNPYGWTKVFQEQILQDLAKANPEMNIAILRYFNPIGAHESGLIGEDPNGIPNNLVPYVAQAAIGKRPSVRIFGDDYDTKDGTGVRDYIHVTDLALGHIAALKKLWTNPGLVIYNLGTGIGYSVFDVVNAFEKACGKKLKRDILPRRAGDIAENYADPTKAYKELGWKAKYNLDDMCRTSWNWQSKNPNGYKG